MPIRYLVFYSKLDPKFLVESYDISLSLSLYPISHYYVIITDTISVTVVQLKNFHLTLDSNLSISLDEIFNNFLQKKNKAIPIIFFLFIELLFKAQVKTTDIGNPQGCFFKLRLLIGPKCVQRNLTFRRQAGSSKNLCKF